MRNRGSYSFALVVKSVLMITLGFLLVSVVVWLFFRNEVRDIGYYLRFGRRDEIALLVSDYLGDPPSRFRARMLAQTYNLTILYREEGRIQWVVERWGLLRRREPMLPALRHMMAMRMMEDHAAMMRQPHVQHIELAGNRALFISFPPPFTRRQPVTPLFFFLSIAVLIGLILFLSLRRTFSPLDHVIEASERIGRGDLSYRISYNREDDFGKVAAAFNTMTAKLSAMLSSQRELLHFVSHELRTPLTRIRLALELKDSNRAHDIIRNEVSEIDSLVEAVSELSRLDHIERESVREPVDIAALLGEVIEASGGENIHYHKREEPSVVMGNVTLLKKALSNLIDNALKYSDGSGPVEVDLTLDRGFSAVSVKNSGPGIPEGEMEKIWEPFYRGTNAAIGKAEGRGLGLVVVKRAVELSRGQVTAHSSMAGPTVFCVRLPMSSA